MSKILIPNARTKCFEKRLVLCPAYLFLLTVQENSIIQSYFNDFANDKLLYHQNCLLHFFDALSLLLLKARPTQNAAHSGFLARLLVEGRHFTIVIQCLYYYLV